MRSVRVWSYDVNDYVEKQAIGIVKYVGKSFYNGGGLTDGKEYYCLNVELPFLRIVDDEEMDYLYSITNPAPLDGSSDGGRWELVEDDDNQTLKKTLKLG